MTEDRISQGKIPEVVSKVCVRRMIKLGKSTIVSKGEIELLIGNPKHKIRSKIKRSDIREALGPRGSGSRQMGLVIDSIRRLLVVGVEDNLVISFFGPGDVFCEIRAEAGKHRVFVIDPELIHQVNGEADRIYPQIRAGVPYRIVGIIIDKSRGITKICSIFRIHQCGLYKQTCITKIVFRYHARLKSVHFPGLGACRQTTDTIALPGVKGAERSLHAQPELSENMR